MSQQKPSPSNSTFNFPKKSISSIFQPSIFPAHCFCFTCKADLGVPTKTLITENFPTDLSNGFIQIRSADVFFYPYDINSNLFAPSSLAEEKKLLTLCKSCWRKKIADEILKKIKCACQLCREEVCYNPQELFDVCSRNGKIEEGINNGSQILNNPAFFQYEEGGVNVLCRKCFWEKHSKVNRPDFQLTFLKKYEEFFCCLDNNQKKAIKEAGISPELIYDSIIKDIVRPLDEFQKSYLEKVEKFFCSKIEESNQKNEKLKKLQSEMEEILNKGDIHNEKKDSYLANLIKDVESMESEGRTWEALRKEVIEILNVEETKKNEEECGPKIK